MESMAKLKPVFKPDGTVTAGNASGMNDAGSAVVMPGLVDSHVDALVRWAGGAAG